jgi:hypothetical protein
MIKNLDILNKYIYIYIIYFIFFFKESISIVLSEELFIGIILTILLLVFYYKISRYVIKICFIEIKEFYNNFSIYLLYQFFFYQIILKYKYLLIKDIYNINKYISYFYYKFYNELFFINLNLLELYKKYIIKLYMNILVNQKNIFKNFIKKFYMIKIYSLLNLEKKVKKDLILNYNKIKNIFYNNLIYIDLIFLNKLRKNIKNGIINIDYTILLTNKKYLYKK